MFALEILKFLGGLVALYFGAEWLVAGSSSLALRLGIAPLIVGLTVVAFGTSAPELLVSLLAVKDGNDGISVGNIIGSNIANIALIMGCAALVNPIQVHPDALKRDYPLMLGASVLLGVLLFDGTLSRIDGAILLCGAALFVGYSVVRGKRMAQEGAAAAAEDDEELSDPSKSTVARDVGLLVLGIAGLAGGAKLLVDSAVFMAKAFHVPDLVIGITVVAIGTSLPELATSVVAAYRKESDISVGNVIGSNIFNILVVLGLVSVLLPVVIKPEVAADVKIDLSVMLATAVVALPIMRVGHRIGRVDGVFFLLGYVAYMVYLFLRQ